MSYDPLGSFSPAASKGNPLLVHYPEDGVETGRRVEEYAQKRKQQRAAKLRRVK